jgi:hypothetical protein
MNVTAKSANSETVGTGHIYCADKVMPNSRMQASPKEPQAHNCSLPGSSPDAGEIFNLWDPTLSNAYKTTRNGCYLGLQVGFTDAQGAVVGLDAA